MNEQIPTIHIDLNKKCRKCERRGAAKNGLCLLCIDEHLKHNEYKEVSSRLLGKTKKELQKSGLTTDELKGKQMSIF